MISRTARFMDGFVPALRTCTAATVIATAATLAACGHARFERDVTEEFVDLDIVRVEDLRPGLPDIHDAGSPIPDGETRAMRSLM